MRSDTEFEGPLVICHPIERCPSEPIASGPVVVGALQTDAAREPIPPASGGMSPLSTVPAGTLLPGALDRVTPYAALRPADPIAGSLKSNGTPAERVASDPTPERLAGHSFPAPRTRSARKTSARDLPAKIPVSSIVVLPADPLRPACHGLSPFDFVPGEPNESGIAGGGAPSDGAALDLTAEGLFTVDTLHMDALGGTCDYIRELWHRRQQWHRAEKSLTLQCKALCRRIVGGDKTLAEKLYKAALGKGSHDLASVALVSMMPLLAARDTIERERLAVEKHVVKLGKETPLAAFVQATHGVGMLSLAGVIGEAGSLSNYAGPAKLWKRMGLAVMPDGQRQRKVSGVEALDHGYSPQRRSLVWTIGDCFVKAGGPYREVYDARKVYETARLDEDGKPFRPIICHRRAKRYAEKRLLQDLWRHWRAA